MKGDSNGFLMTRAPIMEPLPSPGCQLQPRQETRTGDRALMDGSSSGSRWLLHYNHLLLEAGPERPRKAPATGS